MPIEVYPTASAAASVDPAPANGSTTVPSPRGSAPLTTSRRNPCGLRLGCGAIVRSLFPVGAERITSPNGAESDGLRKPPVCHFRKLSCTRPSIGFRNKTHGSHIDLGNTLTPSNSSWAAFGRSPPRMVITNLIIAPLRSNPASESAPETISTSNGFEATTTFAPGLNLGKSSFVQMKKNSLKFAFCAAVNVVKRGSGARKCPSYDGGILHTPLLPLRSFDCSFGVYSCKPYGGSVTTAWMLLSSWVSSQSKQSP